MPIHTRAMHAILMPNLHGLYQPLHDACNKKRCLHLYLVLNDGILFCILLLMTVLNNTFMLRFTTTPSLFNNHLQSI